MLQVTAETWVPVSTETAFAVSQTTSVGMTMVKGKYTYAKARQDPGVVSAVLGDGVA
jgi:hypothetical protein